MQKYKTAPKNLVRRFMSVTSKDRDSEINPREHILSVIFLNNTYTLIAYLAEGNFFQAQITNINSYNNIYGIFFLPLSELTMYNQCHM